MGTSGDKIVLLDGMGSGSGSAANGLLSMIQEKQALATSAITQQQTQNIVSQLAPKAPIPAYVVQNPGCCYTPTVRVANECGCACGTTNAVL